MLCYVYFTTTKKIGKNNPYRLIPHFVDEENEAQKERLTCPVLLANGRVEIWIKLDSGAPAMNYYTGPPSESLNNRKNILEILWSPFLLSFPERLQWARQCAQDFTYIVSNPCNDIARVIIYVL